MFFYFLLSELNFPRDLGLIGLPYATFFRECFLIINGFLSLFKAASDYNFDTKDYSTPITLGTILD